LDEDPSVYHSSVAAPDDRERVELLAEQRSVDLSRQRLTDLAVDGTITKAEVRSLPASSPLRRYRGVLWSSTWSTTIAVNWCDRRWR
jgi:hypothetical protein